MNVNDNDDGFDDFFDTPGRSLQESTDIENPKYLNGTNKSSEKNGDDGKFHANENSTEARRDGEYSSDTVTSDEDSDSSHVSDRKGRRSLSSRRKSSDYSSSEHTNSDSETDQSAGKNTNSYVY